MKPRIIPPTISSVGAPPEQHADRVVAEMLRFLVRGQLERQRHIKAALRLPDGNPQAQAKLARRLEETGWPLILDVRLRKSGKRGRYELDFTALDGYSPIRKKIIGDVKDIPQKPWLAISLVWLESKGNHSYDASSVTAVLITHHALSRLAQRTSVRTVDDLIGAVDAIWSAYAKYVHDHRTVRFPRDHRLTFDIDGGGNALAVLSHDEDWENTIVVKTII
jgi:hypothetical protein